MNRRLQERDRVLQDCLAALRKEDALRAKLRSTAGGDQRGKKISRVISIFKLRFKTQFLVTYSN